jgi:Zn-dependent protease
MVIAGIFVFAGWIVSVCLHEFGHAIVAYWGGDKSVKDKGYLTLNPLNYADPTTSLLFPLVLLLMGGLALPGGAVYINQQQLRNRLWRSAVSLAGPLTNLLVAVLLAIPFQLGWPPFEIASELMASGIEDNWIWGSLAFLILLQISAVVLNLLPIPPLDGYGILEPWLPPSWQATGAKIGRYGFWILLGLFWFVPPFTQAFWQIAYAIAQNLNVSYDWLLIGRYLFQNPVTKLILVLALIGGLWYLKQTGQTQAWYRPSRSCSASRPAARAPKNMGSPISGGFQTWKDARLRKKLLELVKHRQEVADNLITTQKLKNPGHSERWYLEKVIYDLQRGR